MNTDSTADTAVVTSAITRTASGRCRAVNMISTAPTSGIHVMSDKTGNGITPCARGYGGQERCWSSDDGRRSDENGADARRRRKCPTEAWPCHVAGRADRANEADAPFSSPALVHHAAAIYHQRLAGDVAGFIGGEEHGGGADVFGRLLAFHRNDVPDA